VADGEGASEELPVTGRIFLVRRKGVE
jgi:hypothetical protein